MVDLSRLEHLAEMATPGPWAYEAHGDTGCFGVGFLLDEDDQPVEGRQESGEMLVAETVASEVVGVSNAAFIAAANPAAIKELIAENKRLLEKVENFKTQFSELHAARNLLSTLSKAGFPLGEGVAESILAVRHEREQLRTEVEALRADAERYRYLREECDLQWDVMYEYVELQIQCDLDGFDSLDDVVDASMSKEVDHG